jgi:uncharacterized membrane protein YeaQ/YmgE (transglycosylase-associated protein family)
MSSIAVILQLDAITQRIDRYGLIVILLFGIVGNILNCLVFTRRKLRSKPCSIYFLVASVVNMIVLLTTFIPRIIDGWNAELDLIETVSALCQLLMFLLFSTRCISVWIITFASVDRFLVSSRNIHRRQMSNLKNTYCCIMLICIISFAISLEVVFCFDANMVNTPFKCFEKSKICHVYNDVVQGLIINIAPIIVMLIFGFYTIRNIHQSRQVAPNMINRNFILRHIEEARIVLLKCYLFKYYF